MPRTVSLYEQATTICRDYLGPAGERFMARQVMTHLNKPPEALTQADIPELVSWVRLTFALLTNDAEMIQAFSDRLAALAKGSRARARKEGHSSVARV